MAYSKVWPEGWKDNEEGGTYIDAAGLNKMEQGIIDAHDFMARKDNPHSVTKEQVGLGNVPNVATNDQTPTYTAASSLSALSSSEKLSAAFGKLAKAVSEFITAKLKLDGIESGAQKNTITGVKGNAESSYRTGDVNITPVNIGLGNVNNTSDTDKPVSTATQTALNGKQDTLTFDETPTEDSENPVKSGGVAALTNPLYEEKTLGPANHVTLTDGIANATLQSYVVDIAPAQDLHGYTRPWPRGGGRNLLEVTADGIKANNIAGTWSGSAYTISGLTITVNTDDGENVTGIIVNGTAEQSVFLALNNVVPVTTGESYLLSGVPDGFGKNTFSLRVGKGSDNSFVQATTNYDTVQFSAPESTLRCSLTIYSGYIASNLVFRPMLRLASDTDGSFEPYANICPITGWTGAKVTRTGKNLLDNPAGDKSESGITFTVNGDGSITANGTAEKDVLYFIWSRNWTDNARHLPAGRYILTGCPAGGSTSTYSIRFQATRDGTLRSFGEDTGNGVFADILSEDKLQILIQVKSGVNVKNLVFRPMLRLASDTDGGFEPYQAETVTVSFGAAGTVYGGTLNVTTGELTADKAAVDLGTVPFQRQMSATHYTFYSNFSPLKIWTGGNENPSDIICSALKTESWNHVNAPPESGYNDVIGQINTSNQLRIRADEYESAEALMAAMSGVMLVYPLASPVTYRLTPAQVSTLLGVNHIAADCGDVTVTYRGDIANLYALNNTQQSKLDTLEASVAPTEGSFYATRNYSIGEYLVAAGQLYKVTAAIATGGTIAVGTNVKTTTIADELLALFNIVNS